jgi:hypothetical protein
VTAAVFESNCLELPTVRVLDRRRRPTGDVPQRLAAALRRGLPVEPDPRRPDFYEASLDRRRVYFHVYNRYVYLLAVW